VESLFLLLPWEVPDIGLQSDAEFWRKVLEQASKRSSSHEGGLLLDPLHKGTRFPSLVKDREDRQQRVSAQIISSVSGFPHRLLLRLICCCNNSWLKWSTWGKGLIPSPQALYRE
jgi:hypothetical protein